VACSICKAGFQEGLVTVAATVLRAPWDSTRDGLLGRLRSEGGSPFEADFACGFTTRFLFESFKIQKNGGTIWLGGPVFVKDSTEEHLFSVWI